MATTFFRIDNAVESLFPLSSMLRNNREVEDVCAWLRTAKPGDVRVQLHDCRVECVQANEQEQIYAFVDALSECPSDEDLLAVAREMVGHDQYEERGEALRDMLLGYAAEWQASLSQAESNVERPQR